MTCDISLPAIQLFDRLDAHIDQGPDPQSLTSSEVLKSRQERDNQSLIIAIRAFAAPWLPLLSHAGRISSTQVRDIARDSWRTARQDMLKVINRTSYRSILALYLFSQTPIPAGISEDEESDGISGPVCIRTALAQLQWLRARRAISDIDNHASASSVNDASITPKYVDFESRAYWAATMWDTSASLTTDSRTLLTSGLKGACSEPTWRLVKAFLVGSFVPRSENWHQEGFEWTEEVAFEVIAAASICNTYIWKNVTSLKEALREGVQDDGVLFAWNALLDAIDIYRTSILPLLSGCERRLHFLDQRVRLNWYEVTLHHFLGILMMDDALKAAARSDLLHETRAVRQDAEHESFIILKYGLENTYTIRNSGNIHLDATRANESTDLPRPLITATLVAVDPYPQLVVNAVMLMHKRLCRRYSQKSITNDTYSYLLSILLRALQQLPQSSKCVQEACGRITAI
jgi:hypothetical protein